MKEKELTIYFSLMSLSYKPESKIWVKQPVYLTVIILLVTESALVPSMAWGWPVFTGNWALAVRYRDHFQEITSWCYLTTGVCCVSDAFHSFALICSFMHWLSRCLWVAHCVLGPHPQGPRMQLSGCFPWPTASASASKWLYSSDTWGWLRPWESSWKSVPWLHTLVFYPTDAHTYARTHTYHFHPMAPSSASSILNLKVSTPIKVSSKEKCLPDDVLWMKWHAIPRGQPGAVLSSLSSNTGQGRSHPRGHLRRAGMH